MAQEALKTHIKETTRKFFSLWKTWSKPLKSQRGKHTLESSAMITTQRLGSISLATKQLSITLDKQMSSILGGF